MRISYWRSDVCSSDLIDSGRRVLAPELLSPLQGIEHILAAFTAAAGQQGIVLGLVCDAELEPKRLDAAILRDVLAQVIGNAIKFNHAGGRVDIQIGRAHV